MNINSELKQYPILIQNIANWYSKSQGYAKPSTLKEIFIYDLEINLGLILNWLYEEHDIIILATDREYCIAYKDNAKGYDITSIYTKHGVIIKQDTEPTKGLFENYKEAILHALSILNNPKTPF